MPQVNVRIDDAVAERIDAIAGPNRRTEFVRDAIFRCLDADPAEFLVRTMPAPEGDRWAVLLRHFINQVEQCREGQERLDDWARDYERQVDRLSRRVVFVSGRVQRMNTLLAAMAEPEDTEPVPGSRQGDPFDVQAALDEMQVQLGIEPPRKEEDAA